MSEIKYIGSNSTAATIGDMTKDNIGTLSMAITGIPPFDSPTKNADKHSKANSEGLAISASIVGIEKLL